MSPEDRHEFIRELIRLNPDRDDLEVREIDGGFVIEHSSRLGPPRMPCVVEPALRVIKGGKAC